jgi:hypothetical protein
MIKKILIYMLLFWLICIISLESSIIIQDIYSNKINTQQIKALKIIGFYRAE